MPSVVRGRRKESQRERRSENGRKKQMTSEKILKMMEKRLGEEPKPMVLMSKLIPFTTYLHFCKRLIRKEILSWTRPALLAPH